ncbi:MAG: O-antigen ligase family protein [Rubripirellula sp.]
MDFLIALFALACLVWMIPVVQSGRLIVIAMLVLGLGTVFGPSFFAIDGPIQFSLDRIVWFCMFALAVVGWRVGYTKIPMLTRMDWLVIGIVGWFFVSALRGGPVPTGSSPTARWLFYIAMPAGMYLIARLVELREVDVRWMFRGVIALGVYLAITAMFEISGLHGLVFPRFIVDAEVWEFYGRGRGPLMNPSGNGILMTIGFVAAVVGCIYAKHRGKLIYGIFSLIMLVGVYATLTRSSWMGVFFALVVIAMIYAPRGVRVFGLAMVILFGGMSAMGFKDQLIRLKRDKNLTAADAEKSIQLRPLLAIVAWEMFQDHPIIGHGYGHYFEHNDPYHNDRSYNLPLEQARTYAQHNVLLSVLVDTGLVGLSMFVAWLAMMTGIGWQLAREATVQKEKRWVGMLILGTATAYLCNGMFQDVMIIPMVHMFLFFVAGVCVTVHQQGIKSAEHEAARPSPSRMPVPA